MHPDRFFDPEPSVRRLARSIYERTAPLPILSPHGHVDPRLLADDVPFPEPTALFILPDHYVLRMLYSRGLTLERLGIEPVMHVGSAGVERDPRRIWQLFAEHYFLFRGTPTAAWLDYQLDDIFGITQALDAGSALRVYDEIAEKLATPEFRPRALYDRFRIEVLATTDAASDPLAHHKAIRASGWPARVIPTFRPDVLLQVASTTWEDELAKLERVCSRRIKDVAAFVDALKERRSFFKTLGATATDHGVESPYTAWLPADEAEAIFQRARQGTATPDDQRRFQGHLLMVMAGQSVDDGLVMQLHAGSLRNHNLSLFERFGPDRGGDIPVAAEYTRNLRPLLNAVGNDPRFRLLLFTLDESTYSRELAPLAGHYPAVRLGPAWWFFDSIEGMTRYRERVTETAGVYNTAGFNDDTRAFCSIPARHDLARRVDANWLAGLVARHVVELDEAREMARALAYDLARETYRLDGTRREQDTPTGAAAAD
ncbi:MAG: glucuronate isomerase [Longimicrobiaceae bacterium]